MMTYVHVAEALVDLGEGAMVRDVLVDLDFSLQVVCKSSKQLECLQINAPG